MEGDAEFPMNQIDEFRRDNEKVYQVSQALIEIWEAVAEAMKEQDVDIYELSYRTGLPDRELEDYLQNYADAKIGTLFKIVSALGLSIKIN